MKGLSLEIRVGLLILLALGLVGVFVVALSDTPFGGNVAEIQVDFNNPGNLKSGAPGTIGPIRVGRVTGIEYLGGSEVNPRNNEPVMIRVRAQVDEQYVSRIFEDDSKFYVTSTSIVGESILSIDPGNPESEALDLSTPVVGIDPPRMDLAFAMAYELLSNFHELFTEHREDIETLIRSAASMLRQLDGVLTRHSDRIDNIVQDIEAITHDAREAVHSVNEIVSGPRIPRIVRNVDHTLASVARDIDPILADVRSATGKVDDLLDMIGPEQQEEIQAVIHDAAEIAEEVNATIADARAIVSHIREGHGTVGALLMDEELYDDIQEMVRDLKHNPWKLFWRE